MIATVARFTGHARCGHGPRLLVGPTIVDAPHTLPTGKSTALARAIVGWASIILFRHKQPPVDACCTAQQDGRTHAIKASRSVELGFPAPLSIRFTMAYPAARCSLESSGQTSQTISAYTHSGDDRTDDRFGMVNAHWLGRRQNPDRQRDQSVPPMPFSASNSALFKWVRPVLASGVLLTFTGDCGVFRVLCRQLRMAPKARSARRRRLPK